MHEQYFSSNSCRKYLKLAIMPVQKCMQISSLYKFPTQTGQKIKILRLSRSNLSCEESNDALCKFNISVYKHPLPNPSFFNKWVKRCQKNMVSPSWQHAHSAWGESLPSETRSSENYFISQHAPPCSPPCELLLLGGVCRGFGWDSSHLDFCPQPFPILH